jgi:hypothetical protein
MAPGDAAREGVGVEPVHHREERSDLAIPGRRVGDGLLRFARNDDDRQKLSPPA